MDEMKSNEKIVEEINDGDVILGRGKSASGRPGNVYFRKLASENASDYVKASTIEQKTAIARKVLARIEAIGGRFLRSVTRTNANGDTDLAWALAGRAEVLTKVKQAMRDVVKESKKRPRKTKAPPMAVEDQVRFSGDASVARLDDIPSVAEPQDAFLNFEFQRLQQLQQQQLQSYQSLQSSFINPSIFNHPDVTQQQPASQINEDRLPAQNPQLEQERLTRLHQDLSRLQQQEQGLARLQQLPQELLGFQPLERLLLTEEQRQRRLAQLQSIVADQPRPSVQQHQQLALHELEPSQQEQQYHELAEIARIQQHLAQTTPQRQDLAMLQQQQEQVLAQSRQRQQEQQQQLRMVQQQQELSQFRQPLQHVQDLARSRQELAQQQLREFQQNQQLQLARIHLSNRAMLQQQSDLVLGQLAHQPELTQSRQQLPNFTEGAALAGLATNHLLPPFESLALPTIDDNTAAGLATNPSLPPFQSRALPTIDDNTADATSIGINIPSQPSRHQDDAEYGGISLAPTQEDDKSASSNEQSEFEESSMQ